MICYTHRTPKNLEKNPKCFNWRSVFNFVRRPNVDNDCVDARHRWVAHIEHAIKQNYGTQHKHLRNFALKLLILRILVATFEMNVMYLDTIVSHMDNENGAPSVHNGL